MKYFKFLFDLRSRKVNYDSFFYGWFASLAFSYILRGFAEASVFYFVASLAMVVIAKIAQWGHPLE